MVMYTFRSQICFCLTVFCLGLPFVATTTSFEHRSTQIEAYDLMDELLALEDPDSHVLHTRDFTKSQGFWSTTWNSTVNGELSNYNLSLKLRGCGSLQRNSFAGHYVFSNSTFQRNVTVGDILDDVKKMTRQSNSQGTRSILANHTLSSTISVLETVSELFNRTLCPATQILALGNGDVHNELRHLLGWQEDWDILLQAITVYLPAASLALILIYLYDQNVPAFIDSSFKTSSNGVQSTHVEAVQAGLRNGFIIFIGTMAVGLFGSLREYLQHVPEPGLPNPTPTSGSYAAQASLTYIISPPESFTQEVFLSMARYTLEQVKQSQLAGSSHEAGAATHTQSGTATEPSPSKTQSSQSACMRLEDAVAAAANGTWVEVNPEDADPGFSGLTPEQKEDIYDQPKCDKP